MKKWRFCGETAIFVSLISLAKPKAFHEIREGFFEFGTVDSAVDFVFFVIGESFAYVERGEMGAVEKGMAQQISGEQGAREKIPCPVRASPRFFVERRNLSSL